MENKQRGFATIINILILLGVIAAGGGGFFYLYLKQKNSNAVIPIVQKEQQKKQEDNNLIKSDYGFSFVIPQGWHIWEGYSAATEIMDDEFITIIGKAIKLAEAGKELGDDELKKYQEYQNFMNDWKVETSSLFYLTKANFSYKKRDLASTKGYLGVAIGNPDSLEWGTTGLSVSTQKVDFNVKEINDKQREIRPIDIGNTKAILTVVKNFEAVEMVLISLPVISSKDINGEKVQSVVITRYIKKSDLAALQDLMSFISELGISQI